MKIVGSYLGHHDVGVALIENNQIRAIYHEERFRREKSIYVGGVFPTLSVNALQTDFNMNLLDDDVSFATAKPIKHENSEVGELIDRGLVINTYDHHYSHGCGAYYTSGFPNKRTLIFTYDGGDGGLDNITKLDKSNYHRYQHFKYDNTYCATYVVQNDRLVEIDKRITGGSLANLWYGSCGPIYGFQGLKDEGKIMGIAPTGKFDNDIYEQLQFFIDTNALMAFCEYADNIMNDIPDTEKEEFKRNFAYTLQVFTEEWILKHLSYLYETYGPFDNLCLAGGLFSNVKLNQRINEYLKFKNIWVYPGMGDDGLSLGSAIAHALEVDSFTNRPLEHVFFGKKYDGKQIKNELDVFSKKFNKNILIESCDTQRVAELLHQKRVIGVYDGECEFGPRALGHRSILVEPTRRETHDIINARLNRSETMPFAPIILEERVQDVLYYHKSKHTSEFMTLCYTVKPNWMDKIPAVIQQDDNTCRPQVVNRDRNPLFHGILSEYTKLSNIPVLMNTSFNVHGEPIINDTDHALSHLNSGVVDYLIVGIGNGEYLLCQVV